MKFFCIIVVGGGWEEMGEDSKQSYVHLESLSELFSLRSQKKIKMNFQFREASL